MIDYNLKPCPFCGNPAEIIDTEAPEWHSKAKHVRICCSNKYCPMHDFKGFIACVEEYCNTLDIEKSLWNCRRRKNKLTFNEVLKNE